MTPTPLESIQAAGRYRLVRPGTHAQLSWAMKTLSTLPAWMLYLLAPMMALAQTAPPDNSRRETHQVVTSPLLWYWVAVLVVAAAAFAFVSFRLSKRKQPPHRPSTP